jgi:hypothetical protein
LTANAAACAAEAAALTAQAAVRERPTAFARISIVRIVVAPAQTEQARAKQENQCAHVFLQAVCTLDETWGRSYRLGGKVCILLD